MKFVIETGADNPILRTTCDPVSSGEMGQYRKIGKSMVKYIKDPEHGGIGLAAPQIGITKRMMVCGLPMEPDDESYPIVLMINPEIIEFGEEKDLYEEGCLSLPDDRGIVQRPTSVKVQFLDEKGKKHVRNVAGFGARVIQHELDHLNGILFIDKLFRTNGLTD